MKKNWMDEWMNEWSEWSEWYKLLFWKVKNSSREILFFLKKRENNVRALPFEAEYIFYILNTRNVKRSKTNLWEDVLTCFAYPLWRHWSASSFSGKPLISNIIKTRAFFCFNIYWKSELLYTKNVTHWLVVLTLC